MDTNVVVSALVFGGKPAIALQLIEALDIEVVASAELEAELLETLTGKFGWSAEAANAARGRIYQNALRVEPDPLTGVSRDRDDNHVLAAAVTSRASVIVTATKTSYRSERSVVSVSLRRRLLSSCVPPGRKTSGQNYLYFCTILAMVVVLRKVIGTFSFRSSRPLVILDSLCLFWQSQ